MGYEESLKNCMEAHRLAALRPKVEARAATAAATNRILFGLESQNSRAGVSVTPTSAMRTSAVWACVRVLSTSMACLPRHIYRNLVGGGHEIDLTDPITHIVHDAPNPEQTSFVFHQTAMAQCCLYGNSYAEIQVDADGNKVAEWPIPPWCCQPLRTQKGELFYQIIMPNTGEIRNLPPYRIMHFMGLTTDGTSGLSPIRQHMESIGISLAAERFGGLFFGQGMNVGGVAEHPKILTEQGSKNLRDSLNEQYGGLGNSHRLLLLEEGMKYQRVGIPPNEAQFLETRNFQIEDIARIFGVQLHKIGHLLHATNNNIEHQGMEFVTDTILPWAVNWEQEYDRKLCNPGTYLKHSLEGLLRGDSASRAAFYKELFYISSISPDEIREKEDWNPIPDGMGKRYYVQANMVPADKIDDYIAKGGASPPSPVRSVFIDIIRRIAEKEKQGLIRAYKKNPANFKSWLIDYYRDFKDYIVKVSEPALGPKAQEFALRYIEKSKFWLKEVDCLEGSLESVKVISDWIDVRSRDNCLHYHTDETDLAKCGRGEDGIFQENCGSECPLFEGG